MDGTGSLLLLALPIVLLAYLFFMQRRAAATARDLQAGLATGDEVITTSGLYGEIVALTDTTVTLKVAKGVQVVFDRRAIGSRVGGAPEADTGETS